MHSDEDKKIITRQKEFTLTVAQLILFAYARGHEIMLVSIGSEHLSFIYKLMKEGIYDERAVYLSIGEKWRSLGGTFSEYVLNELKYNKEK